MAPVNDGDRVVRELDVYLCTGVLPQNTKLLLVQYPLRPPWRPYDERGYDKVRVKPKAVKVELEAQLPTAGPNYDAAAERSKKIDKIKLTSSKVDMRTTFACGSIRDDKLLLTPIDNAVQLRPSLAHLDEATPKKPKDDAEEADKPIVAYQVQMKKRETERQQQARLQSYAYLTQQVEEEPWLDMMYHDSYSQAAENVWERMMTAPTEKKVDMDMTRQQYLQAIVPGMSSRSTPSSTGPAGVGAEGDAMDVDGVPEEQQATGQEFIPTEAAAKELPIVMRKLLSGHMVVSLEDIRMHLQEKVSAVVQYSTAPDADLHHAVMSTHCCLYIQKVYVRHKLDNAALDPFRDVVLDLFKEKEALKKADIMEAARAAGLQVTDQLYTRIMRALCISKGAQWYIQPGKD